MLHQLQILKKSFDKLKGVKFKKLLPNATFVFLKYILAIHVWTYSATLRCSDINTTEWCTVYELLEKAMIV